MKSMTVIYKIQENTREIKVRDVLSGKAEIYVGCTLDQQEQEPVTQEQFDNLDAALKALKKYTGTVTFHPSAVNYYLVTEYFVERMEYNELGCLENSDFIEFAALDIHELDA